jgi:GntR family transcriptional regulator
MASEKFLVSVDPAAHLPLGDQLKEQIKWLIALGDLHSGDRLPTVSELADRLRINRNTVAQAYLELGQEGYVIARSRQGTFVAESDAVRRVVQNAALGKLVDEALNQAVGLGFTPAQFAEAAGARAQVQAALGRCRKALFVECNWGEIEKYAQTVREETGITVTGLHLDDVRKDQGAFCRRAGEVDLTITTLFHLEEVQRSLGPEAEVVGLSSGPGIELLRSLAQLPRGTTVAICCLDREKATNARTIVTNAGVQHLELLACGVDEVDRLQQALAQCDLVYVSAVAYAQACRLVADPARLRTYEFHLDRAGLEMLKVRLAQGKASPAL